MAGRILSGAPAAIGSRRKGLRIDPAGTRERDQEAVRAGASPTPCAVMAGTVPRFSHGYCDDGRETTNFPKEKVVLFNLTTVISNSSEARIRMSEPKAFISYSWSSPTHQKWVLALATRLREDGVDVSLDKWDLKEGHDALAFMERMVSDPAVTKVIIVSDKAYAEKADGRQGGVGTEAQIISPKIYAESKQDKFCAVVAEVDNDGRPYLPIYCKSRIYVDLSDDDAYATNYEQLLRWIFGKPAFPKPSLGRPPSFVTDEYATILPVDSKFRRAADAIKQNSPNSLGSLNDYLDALSSSFEALRIAKNASDVPFDDRVVRSIEGFLPYRNEFIEVVRNIAQNKANDSYVEAVHRFFERVAPFLTMPPRGISSWSSLDFDNFRFIISELFLYTNSLLLRYERFDWVSFLLNSKYYLDHEVQYGREAMQSFGVLYQETDSLKSRNERLKLNKFSLRAELIEQRSHASNIEFRYLMQGDFTLFLQNAKLALQSKSYVRWWPETLIYAERIRAPFEIYARAESSRYFDRLKTVFEMQTKDEFAPLVEAFNGRQMGLPGPSPFYSPNPVTLMNYEKLASIP